MKNSNGVIGWAALGVSAIAVGLGVHNSLVIKKEKSKTLDREDLDQVIEVIKDISAKNDLLAEESEKIIANIQKHANAEKAASLKREEVLGDIDSL